MNVRTFKKKPRNTYLHELPKVGIDYLNWCKNTLKPDTCKNRRTALRAFYTFLSKHNLSVEDIDRTQIVEFLGVLKQQGLAASSRMKILTRLRQYLWWLYDEHIITFIPDQLIRNSDLPTVPSYLPRPLPIDIDIELQKRFAESKSVLLKGLLLMRNTGLRIGELMAMPYDCLHSNHAGNTFIKVPLGKLDNERLVPLDEKTVGIVRELQQQNPTTRTYLIEHSCSKIKYNQYRLALKHASKDLDTNEPITSHRFRHSYACSLINAGMRIESIKKLLGHTDIRMTLIYADVTLETISKEFYHATNNIEEKYKIFKNVESRNEFNPTNSIAEIIAWIHRARRPTDIAQNKTALLLIKRMHKLKIDLEQFVKNKR